MFSTRAIIPLQAKAVPMWEHAVTCERGRCRYREVLSSFY